MSEQTDQPGRMPGNDELLPAAIIRLDQQGLDGADTREEPRTVSDSKSREHTPSGVTSTPVRDSTSDSALDPQDLPTEEPQTVTDSKSREHTPSGVTSTPVRDSTSDSALDPQDPPAEEPQAVTDSKSREHTSSGVTSSPVRDSASDSALDPQNPSNASSQAPAVVFTEVSAEVSAEPQFNQYPFETTHQLFGHNPVDFAGQFNFVATVPPDVFTFNHHPYNTTNMGWPFDLSGAPNMGEFERFEKASIEELLQPSSIPFASVAEMRPAAREGVVMISNIPYSVTRQEVASFLGRSATLLPSTQGCPIHIIMERSTGKTMDCYVEFATVKDAQDTVDRINRTYDAGSAPRMGSRHVDLELSTPAKLLKATFPRAKCISWEDGNPVQLVNKDPWSTGFDGFLTDEELFCLTRHAEQPHRSAFANKVPQRAYESFVSTIWKFPWHATHLYTVHHRNALFKTLGALIRALSERIQKTNTVGLDIRLLHELVHAGISCPAFNPRMKYCFAWWSNDQGAIESLDHDWCLYFPFDTLTYVPGHTTATYQYYAYVMSHGSVLRTENDGLPNKHTLPELERIFGRVWFEWDNDVARKKVFKDAIIYDASVLRKFIITGFQQLHRRQSSVSTIGTAPDSSPTQSIASVDSQRTISVSHNPSVNPGPAYEESSIVPASSNMPSSFPEYGNTSNVPGNPHGSSQRLDADRVLSDTTPTHRSHASIPPYRPPHQRPADSTTPRNQSFNWRMPQTQEAHAAGSTQSQAVVQSVYRAPHPTAHNVRSSSDPFGPVPSTAASSHRSRSDATRLSNIDRRAFDELRAAGHGPRPAKK
ncbi:hypothetical protein N7516_006531 [Penicillium verrucosum]|uniref:uncharacterized protein n=1 Tax=Penicillium verrucosum TaxID=60171 RepID=UPI002544DEC1|nr:uncharacterized protein N7516_006531 [Penicillium verrucosum]KAJ5932042.1 hypothetical protein N7516_006531 [Penicillium verrucosum]